MVLVFFFFFFGGSHLTIFILHFCKCFLNLPHLAYDVTLSMDLLAHTESGVRHFGIFINQSVLGAKQHPALHSVFGTEQKVFQTVKKTTPQTNKQAKQKQPYTFTKVDCGLCLVFPLLRKRTSTNKYIFFVITFQLPDFFRLKIPVIILSRKG